MLNDTQVYFAGNDLSQVVAATLYDHNFNDIPEREIKTYKLARANKSITTSAEYSSKQVTVSFILRGCDRGETEAVMRRLKSLLRPINQDLSVSQGGVDTIYRSSTLNELSYRWVSNKAMVELTFIVADPVAYEDAVTIMLNTNVTSSASSSGVTNAGSFDAEPIINLTINAVTGGTGQSLSLKNEETGQGITISADFSDGDTIEVNTALQEIVMNGAIIDFAGQFPKFPPGTGVFGYSDTFSTRDVDVSITYVRRDI